MCHESADTTEVAVTIHGAVDPELAIESLEETGLVVDEAATSGNIVAGTIDPADIHDVQALEVVETVSRTKLTGPPEGWS